MNIDEINISITMLNLLYKIYIIIKILIIYLYKIKNIKTNNDNKYIYIQSTM